MAECNVWGGGGGEKMLNNIQIQKIFDLNELNAANTAFVLRRIKLLRRLMCQRTLCTV